MCPPTNIKKHKKTKRGRNLRELWGEACQKGKDSIGYFQFYEQYRVVQLINRQNNKFSSQWKLIIAEVTRKMDLSWVGFRRKFK